MALCTTSRFSQVEHDDEVNFGIVSMFIGSFCILRSDFDMIKRNC